MKNHLGEKVYTTFQGWKRAAKKAGADRFEGTASCMNAIGPNPVRLGFDKGVGEWDGETGCIYNGRE